MAVRCEKKRCLRLARVMALALVASLLYLAVLAVRIYLAGQHDECERADIIIVLGAAQYDGNPTPVFQGRIDHALSLYHGGFAPYLLFTGGRKPGDRFTEAGTGRAQALRNGVPDGAIFTEEHGRTTMQSLQAASSIMHAQGLTTAILVSDPFHAYRLRRMARDIGLHAVISPAPNSRVRSPEMQARFILREMMGYLVYRLVGI